MANAVLGLALAQARGGAEVRIAAADEGGRPMYGDASDAETFTLPWKPRWRVHVGPLVLRGVPRSLRREVRAFAPDVVHAHAEFNPDNIWALRLGGRDAVVVLSPQGAFDPGVFRKSRARSKRLYSLVASKALYERLTAFHALSPREDEQVRAIAPHVSRYVLPQGGGPAALGRSGASPAPTSVTKLLFVGRLDVFTKGLDLLLQALAGLVRDRIPVHVTLVGPDFRGGRSRLETLAAALGVAPAVSFTGALTGGAVALALDDADCVVLPSRHEGLSLAATEALLRGKPLVLSSQTGHASYPEVSGAPSVLAVAPTVAGIELALRTACARRDELRELALRHRPVFAELFSWDRIARRHLENYEQLRSA